MLNRVLMFEDTGFCQLHKCKLASHFPFQLSLLVGSETYLRFKAAPHRHFPVSHVRIRSSAHVACSGFGTLCVCVCVTGVDTGLSSCMFTHGWSLGSQVARGLTYDTRVLSPEASPLGALPVWFLRVRSGATFPEYAFSTFFLSTLNFPLPAEFPVAALFVGITWSGLSCPRTLRGGLFSVT